MSYHGITWIALVLFCACFSAESSAKESRLTVTQYSQTENLRVRCRYTRDLPTLFHISQTCSLEVRKWLRTANKRPENELTILFSDQPVEEKLNPFSRKVWIFPGDSPEMLYHCLLSVLIGRYVVENCRGKDRNIPALSWMCAGLYHRIYYDGKGFTLRYTPDFRIAREQFENGFYPSLELLLTHPVTPEKTYLYRLYALYCDVFLKVIEELDPKHQSVQKNFLEFMSYNRPQIGSLQFLLKDRIGTRTLDAWYREQMYRESGSGIRKAEAELVARQLRELVTVPFIDKDRPGEITDCPVYELSFDKLTEQFLRERRIRLAILHLRAPLLMQPSIYMFIEALKCRTARRMKKEYQNAQASFDAAFRRQKTAENLLESREKNAPGKMGEFASDWNIIQRYQGLRQSILGEALK